MKAQHTPGPWRVRTLERNGQVVDCFVCANDTQGNAYDAEIMGDDEYRDGIERKLADARLIAAAPDLLDALKAAKQLFDEALPKFNWGASALDANAIRLLNEAPMAVNSAIAKATGGAA